MNAYNAQRLQYLMTRTPADDRHGMHGIGGPAFEMSGADDDGSADATPIVDATPITTAPIADARTFILAGKAIFTLVGLVDRYTYKVTKREADGEKYRQDSYFVSLLTGPENTTDYTYLGILDARTGAVRLTKASRLTDDSTPIKAIRWAFSRIWASKTIEPATILHAGRCGRCGRLLTVPESVISGYGPECIGRL